jgi:hypothetical protein
VEVREYRCHHKGKTYVLIDTPSFDDSYRSNDEIVESILDWLEKSYRARKLLSGIIYLHRISDVKMQGSSLENLRMFRKLCGFEAMKHVLLVTTFWDRVTNAQGKQRVQELSSNNDFWGRMIQSGSKIKQLSKGSCDADVKEILSAVVPSAVRGLKIFKAICGADNFHGVTMATTFWDKVDDFNRAHEDNKQLMSNANFWKDLVDGKCATQSLTAGKTSAIELVTAIAHSKKRLVLNMQRQLVDQGLRIYNTDAGKVLQESWFQEKSGLQSRLADTKEELAAAMATNEAERQQELQLHYKELSNKINQQASAVKELCKPTKSITDTWNEKAMETLELRKMQYDDTTFRLEQAMALLDCERSNSPRHEEQLNIVDDLFKQQEVTDRLQSIEIASYSVKLSESSLQAAIVSGVTGVISAGVAVAPYMTPLLAACNVM